MGQSIARLKRAYIDIPLFDPAGGEKNIPSSRTPIRTSRKRDEVKPRSRKGAGKALRGLDGGERAIGWRVLAKYF